LIDRSADIGRALRGRQRGFLLDPYRFGSSVNADALAIYNAVLNGGKGAYWDFEENDATTQFLDGSGNANHLTTRDAGSTVATSTTHGGAGHIGRGFYINNTTQRTAYIPRANTNLDLPNANHFFGGWFVTGTSGGSARFAIGRIGTGGTNQCFLYVDSDDYIKAGASTDGSTTTIVSSAVAASATGEWRLLAFSFDRTNNLIRIRLKSATQDANVTAAFASALYTTSNAANFVISSALASDTSFFSGSRQLGGGATADMCFFGTGATLSENQFQYLYNSGAGKTWAQLKSDAGH